MRVQKIAAAGLLVALGVAGYGIFAPDHPSEALAKKASASQAVPVDQTPLKAAQQLAQLADTSEEQALAKEALRLSDYELDLAFNIALQDAEAHSPELSAEAKEIQARLQKAQKFQQALQSQVNQLTAEVAKASGGKKDALQDQLDLARANLDVATNDVEDAKRDLTDAGGNIHDRIEKMKEQHEEADKERAAAEQKFPTVAPERVGVLHRVQRWMELNAKKKLPQRAKNDADSLVASLAEQHNALSAQIDAEKFNSPDLAAHSKLSDAVNGTPPSEAAASSVTDNVRKARSAADAKAALATTKAVTTDQRNLASLDKRVDNEKELSATYGAWTDLVSDRQREMVQRILIGTAIILGIALIGLFSVHGWKKYCKRPSWTGVRC